MAAIASFFWRPITLGTVTCVGGLDVTIVDVGGPDVGIGVVGGPDVGPVHTVTGAGRVGVTLSGRGLHAVIATATSNAVTPAVATTSN